MHELRCGPRRGRDEKDEGVADDEGQEALLLELAPTGPMIQAQLSDALGCEPPNVTLMTRKLEASGHIRRTPAATRSPRHPQGRPDGE